ncbi:type II toxin-antitoxin system PemK/MazF family toxin [Microseira sp. BLCC-F43]|uniref:type II toxin-antitoxin system PemK/MazF family toxin n=1 Tax=Microseira sp. BLCC-F43 TaxID=3153602 RepID=UPI0035B99D84
MVSGSAFNVQRSKVTVLPFTSALPNDPRISLAMVFVPSSVENGLAVDSLLVCVDPMTFDKSRLVQRLGQLETELMTQAQAILRQYLRL